MLLLTVLFLEQVSLPFAYDGERVIDDFVLLVSLCGNDFLPHLPSLDIGEGAIDVLLRTYRDQLPAWGGYLCDGGLINVARLEDLLRILGSMEADVFRLRAAEAAKWEKRARKQAKRDAAGGGHRGNGRRRGNDDDESDDDELDKKEELTKAEGDAKFLEELLKKTGHASTAATGAPPRHHHEAGGHPHGHVIEAGHIPHGAAVSIKERYYFEKFGVCVGHMLTEDEAVRDSVVQVRGSGVRDAVHAKRSHAADAHKAYHPPPLIHGCRPTLRRCSGRCSTTIEVSQTGAGSSHFTTRLSRRTS